ncbi:polysaccharide lyase family 8 super-sandwich domain-containing protein [Asanoa sp. NPDC049573]|uniref:CBM96 family carbohydrate-binding protein n=1 Tax=Asanoa sp. NPDC049573 TaxID=3155396 RepID=UPI0034188337
MDGLDAMRSRWLQLLADAPVNHGGDPRYTARLDTIGRAERHRDTMSLAAGDGRLWPADFDYRTPDGVSGSFARLEDMAKAYATPGTALDDRASLLEATVAGLNQMTAAFYNVQTPTPHPLTTSSSQWYTWEITIPQSIMDVSILLRGSHPDLQIPEYVAAITHFSPTCSRYGRSARSDGGDFIDPATSANLVWKCTIQALSGALLDDSTVVAAARGLVLQAFDTVTVGDGFYADGSFIQHGRNPYTASYGSALLNTLARLTFVLDGSAWAIPDDDRDRVVGWLRDGFRPLIYRGATSDGVRGRTISDAGNRGRLSNVYLGDHEAGQSLIGTALLLAEVSPASTAAELRGMAKGLMRGDTFAPYPDEYWPTLFTVALSYRALDDTTIPALTDLTTTKMYAGMDQVAHQRPGFMFGVSMFSNRTFDYEGINGDNRKGWFTRYGMTQLLTPDDLGQYADAYWATVDPTRLPGTTVSTAVARSTSEDGGTVSTAAWAGGAVLDNRYASVGMELRDPYSTLAAKKSWFLYDDEIVALGAGITGTGGVLTTVDQRRVTDADTLTVNGSTHCAAIGSTESVTGTVSAHISGQNIGYYFPGGATLWCKRELRSGSWKDVGSNSDTTVYQRSYVTLWIDHGTNPTAGSYAYVVLPGVTNAQASAYAAAPKVTVVRNDADVQAVQHSTLDIVGANFWRNATQTLAARGDTSYLTVDGAASVVIQHTAAAVRLAVADPTQQRTGALHLRLDALTNGLTSRTAGVRLLQAAPAILSVPCLGMAGASATAVLALDTRVLEPTDDASTWPANPTTNYGSSGLIVKTTNDSYTRRTYLKFDVKNIPPDQITSATLRLYGSNRTGSLPQVDVALQAAGTDAWSDSGVTWNNQPAITGGPVGNITVGTNVQYYDGDITSYVRAQATADGLVSVVLTDPATTGEYLFFNNREASENPPQLVLSMAAPETDLTQQPSSSIGAVADGYVDSGDIGKVGGQDLANVVKYDSARQRLTYLAFDLSQYSYVSSATLRVYAKIASGPTTGTVNVSGTTDTWNESLISWGNRPAAGTALGSIPVTSTGGYVTLDATSYVQAQLADGRASFVLNSTSGSAGRYVTVDSRETAAHPPQLVLKTERVASVAADTYVDSGNINSRFGSATSLKANAGQQVVVLQAGIASALHVNRVTLRMYARCTTPYTIRAYGSADGGWSEPNTNWSTRPSPTSLPLGDIACTSTGWIELDITGFAVAQWLEDKMVSVQIVTTSATDLIIDARETANVPQLKVSQN